MTVGERAALPWPPGRGGLLVFGRFSSRWDEFSTPGEASREEDPARLRTERAGAGAAGGREGWKEQLGEFFRGGKNPPSVTPKIWDAAVSSPLPIQPRRWRSRSAPSSEDASAPRGIHPGTEREKGPKSRLSHPNCGCPRLCGPPGVPSPRSRRVPGDAGGMGMIPKTRPELGAEPEPEPGDERRGFGVKTRERSAGRAAGWGAEGSGAGSGDERRRFGFSRGAGFQPARAGRAPGQGPRAAKPGEKRIFRAG